VGTNTHLVPTVEFSKPQNRSLAISADRMSDDRLDPLTVDPVTGAESVASDLVGVRRERPGPEGSSATSATYCPADVASDAIAGSPGASLHTCSRFLRTTSALVAFYFCPEADMAESRAISWWRRVPTVSASSIQIGRF
jgi:hypothetical protein